MSLTKLLMAPIKLFKKDVITFLIIRRHDLGTTNENLSYIAVRPAASISVLRQKVWHLLNLPDYCEEVIILKSPSGVEMPLTELRKGNDPQKPYLLEVWPPVNQDCKTTNILNNMIAYNNNDNANSSNWSTVSVEEENKECLDKCQTAVSSETVALNKMRGQTNLIYTDLKKSDVSCKMSRSSLFKMNGRKSQDNFTNLLLKIQNDLSTLSTKMSALENKITL